MELVGMNPVEYMGSAQRNKTDEESCIFAQQLITSGVLPMTLSIALELDLLEILKNSSSSPLGWMTAADVAVHLPTQNADSAMMVDRIFRLLASYNVVASRAVTVSDELMVRYYRPTPVCEWLTKDENGVSSLAPLPLLGMISRMHCWSLEEGIASERAFGVTGSQFFNSNPEMTNLFIEGTKGLSAMITKKLIEFYHGFDGINTLVDVGGGTGTALQMIVSKYDHIKGIYFDSPHEIAKTIPCQGVEHVSGDMFVKVPCGDAILLQRILHAWGDEDCIKILKNCYEALPDNGKVIIVESIVPAYPDANPRVQSVCNFDLFMLLHSPGGRERTEKEFEVLVKEAGFAGFSTKYVFANFFAMDCTK